MRPATAASIVTLATFSLGTAQAEAQAADDPAMLALASHSGCLTCSRDARRLVKWILSLD